MKTKTTKSQYVILSSRNTMLRGMAKNSETFLWTNNQILAERFKTKAEAEDCIHNGNICCSSKIGECKVAKI